MADEIEPITLDQFEGTLHEMGRAVAQFPIDQDKGRQRDPGARLQYAGYVLLFQYEDPAVPGKTFTANPSAWHVSNAADARFQVSENLDITNGVVGRRVNLLQQFVDNFGEARPLLAVLSVLGRLTPILRALITDVASRINAGGLLGQLLTRARAVPGEAAVRRIAVNAGK